jgi:pimeloyl-ACP methyl ester carboxylesterase
MNRESSMYVDQIATAKLIGEKLGLMPHDPGPLAPADDTDVRLLSDLPGPPEEVAEVRTDGGSELTFPSALRTGIAENDVVRCRYSAADKPAGDLILVHGLYEDNPRLYDFFVAQANAEGMNVHVMTLPYHYGRTPAGSRFSGEFFWSANMRRSVQAYVQAVLDLCQLWKYARQRSGGPVGIAGFSMGGGIALSLAARTPLDRLVVVNPVCNIAHLVWTSVLFGPIRERLVRDGMSAADVASTFGVLEPLNADVRRTDAGNIALARSLYDQISDPANCDLLARKWSIRTVWEYKAGHLNILRLPRLAPDVARFCLGERTA